MLRVLFYVWSLLCMQAAQANEIELPRSPMVTCEREESIRHPQPQAYLDIARELELLIGEMLVGEAEDFIPFRIETLVSECLRDQALARFQYAKIIIQHWVESTAPRRCPQYSNDCKMGALANITISLRLSAHKIALEPEQMLRWVAAQATCYVRITQLERTGDEVNPHLLERCVMELIGVAEQYQFYLAAGYDEEAVGRYLASLRERFHLSW